MCPLSEGKIFRETSIPLIVYLTRLMITDKILIINSVIDHIETSKSTQMNSRIRHSRFSIANHSIDWTKTAVYSQQPLFAVRAWHFYRSYMNANDHVDYQVSIFISHSSCSWIENDIMWHSCVMRYYEFRAGSIVRLCNPFASSHISRR